MRNQINQIRESQPAVTEYNYDHHQQPTSHHYEASYQPYTQTKPQSYEAYYEAHAKQYAAQNQAAAERSHYNHAVGQAHVAASHYPSSTPGYYGIYVKKNLKF